MNLVDENLIFDKYKKIAESCVSKYYTNIDADDILQEALLGLLLAIRSYEDTHGCSFKTFAYICINNRIKTFLVSQKHHTTIIDDIYIIKDSIEDVLPDSLTDIEKEIVYFRLYSYTLKEIAEYYNISLSSMKYKYNKLINKIRRANV